MVNLMDFMMIMKIVIAVSIFFVWIVRYSNIISEFEEYGFPNWFRDIMGIIKCSAAVMLLFGTPLLTIIATVILSGLMLSAFIVHIKSRHTLVQMLPSFSLTLANLFLFYNSAILL